MFGQTISFNAANQIFSHCTAYCKCNWIINTECWFWLCALRPSGQPRQDTQLTHNPECCELFHRTERPNKPFSELEFMCLGGELDLRWVLLGKKQKRRNWTKESCFDVLSGGGGGDRSTGGESQFKMRLPCREYLERGAGLLWAKVR